MLQRCAAMLALAGAILTLTACGGSDSSSSTSTSPQAACPEVAKPEPKRVDLDPPPQTVARGEQLTAVVDTSCGTFEIALDASRFPRTVNSFVYLARKGVYDDTAFHRIVPHFVIQGGDPLENGMGGPGYSVTEAPPANATYRLGTAAMAKTAVEPSGRSGSQFFVVIAPDAGLPPQYAILGKVSSGLDVVKRIGTLGDPKSGEAGTPLSTVVIRGITIQGS